MQPALSTSNHSHNLILRRAITPLQLIRTNHERHSSNLFGDKVTGDHNLKIYSFEFCKKKKKKLVSSKPLYRALILALPNMEVIPSVFSINLESISIVKFEIYFRDL